jgi:ribosomal protein S18 acetylase RimI-like enzyme
MKLGFADTVKIVHGLQQWSQSAKNNIALRQANTHKFGIFTISPITEKEVDSVYSLQIFFNTTTPIRSYEKMYQMAQQSRRDLAEHNTGFFAIRHPNGQIVGYCCGTTKMTTFSGLDSRGHVGLECMRILDNYQNRGLAETLAKYMLTKIFQKNPNAEVWVEAKHNNCKIRELIKKCGFEHIDTMTAYAYPCEGISGTDTFPHQVLVYELDQTNFQHSRLLNPTPVEPSASLDAVLPAIPSPTY